MIVRSALEKAGATDPDYIIFKHGGLEKYELDKDGSIKDLDNLIKQSKENNPSFFKQETPPKDDKKIIDNKLPGGDPGTGDTVTDLRSAISQYYKN
ncbi:hypothetical protein [Tepidibacillus marianensis]|uniref:phage scaffolding protein n=1 Tax=Tepidibacillus marianensis TaxID=3131995 RepID=UPI0030CF69CB